MVNLFVVSFTYYSLLALRLLLQLWPIRQLFLLIPVLKCRDQFEKLNASDPFSRPFLKNSGIETTLFEVSSEGELEQVYPVLENCLERGHQIEIVFSSQSVFKKIHLLAKENPLRIRYLRLPLLHFNPFGDQWKDTRRWSCAGRWFFCRYDFYPELLKHQKVKILLSATLKTKKSKLLNPLIRPLVLSWYKSFYGICPVTQEDHELFESFFPQTRVYESFDFRIPQILKRLELKNEKFITIKGVKDWYEFVSHFEKKTLILGSAWPQDLALLNHQEIRNAIVQKELLVVLAPHKLSQNFIEQISQIISDHYQHYYKIGPHDPFDSEMFNRQPGPVIMIWPGILCEMYPAFGTAYVGNGFGRSVHSLLEPYLSGCQIVCGPAIGRSTEYDLIMERSDQKINVIRSTEQSLLPFTVDRPFECEGLKQIKDQCLGSLQELLGDLCGPKI